MSTRGWQMNPTASGIRHQVQKEFAVSLGAEDGGRRLPQHTVSDRGGELAKLAQYLRVYRRVAHHATLSDLPLAGLELALAQGHHTAPPPQQPPNPRHHPPKRHE